MFLLTMTLPPLFFIVTIIIIIIVVVDLRLIYPRVFGAWLGYIPLLLGD